jgi:cell division protein FtsQ
VVRSRVDPRLVERRRVVRAEADRRHRRRIVGLALVAAVVLGAIGLLLSPLLDVDRVEVAGAERLGAERVVELSGIRVGEPMAAADLAAARRALQADPGLAAAHVVRSWPSTVRIEVVEHRPAALVVHPAGTLVVSAAGTALAAGSGGPDELPRIELDATPAAAPGEQLPEALRAVVALVEQVDPAIAPLVEAHRLSADGTLEWLLQDGATVRFGRVADVPAKLQAAETVLSQVELACLSSLDVREPSRATVRRRDGCDVPPPTVRLDRPLEGTGDASGATDADADAAGAEAEA